MQNEVQEQFDALVAQYGAVAVIEAYNNHTVHPNGGGCTNTSCPTGYICVSGVCKLDGGGG